MSRRAKAHADPAQINSEIGHMRRLHDVLSARYAAVLRTACEGANISLKWAVVQGAISMAHCLRIRASTR